MSSLCNTPSPCQIIALPITSSLSIYTPLYTSAITAPTTPNIPTPTFTLPAALFPVTDVALALPVPVPPGVELPVAVELPLVVFAALVLALVFTVELPVNIVEPETEDAVVEAAADETVFVETTEN
jgi:hypothetical protein